MKFNSSASLGYGRLIRSRPFRKYSKYLQSAVLIFDDNFGKAGFPTI